MLSRYRNERPLCRQTIEKFGLKLAKDGKPILDRDGKPTGASLGIRTQLNKQSYEMRQVAASSGVDE
jgi:hypothetical protein